LTKKFNRFLKKKGKDKAQSSKWYNSKKSTDSNNSNYTYFDVENKGISRLNLPMLQTKRKAMTRNLRKEEKE